MQPSGGCLRETSPNHPLPRQAVIGGSPHAWIALTESARESFAAACRPEPMNVVPAADQVRDFIAAIDAAG
jgi:hypothetical protein